jgi:hypothetical protein
MLLAKLVTRFPVIIVIYGDILCDAIKGIGWRKSVKLAKEFFFPMHFNRIMPHRCLCEHCEPQPLSATLTDIDCLISQLW